MSDDDSRPSQPEAAALTERIRQKAERTWALLVEAYEGGAWQAMDYASWDAFVTGEFDTAAHPAHRLLERARLEPADETEPAPMELSDTQAREFVDQLVLSLEALTMSLDMLDLSTMPSDPQAARVVREAVTTFARLGDALSGSPPPAG